MPSSRREGRVIVQVVKGQQGLAVVLEVGAEGQKPQEVGLVAEVHGKGDLTAIQHAGIHEAGESIDMVADFFCFCAKWKKEMQSRLLVMCGSLCGVRGGREVTYTGALPAQAHSSRSSPTCFRALLKTPFLAVVCIAQELSSSLRDTYRSGVKAQKGRGICLHIAASSCFTAETNKTGKAAILQLKKKSKNSLLPGNPP